MLETLQIGNWGSQIDGTENELIMLQLYNYRLSSVIDMGKYNIKN